MDAERARMAGELGGNAGRINEEGSPQSVTNQSRRSAQLFKDGHDPNSVRGSDSNLPGLQRKGLGRVRKGRTQTKRANALASSG